MKIDGAENIRKMRDAKTLDWNLPYGHFRAEVAGLGAALDAVIACRTHQGAKQG